jgi:hypothetical protein
MIGTQYSGLQICQNRIDPLETCHVGAPVSFPYNLLHMMKSRSLDRGETGKSIGNYNASGL